jgi:hypothetical protein
MATERWRRNGAFSRRKVLEGCDLCECRGKQDVSTVNNWPPPDVGWRLFCLPAPVAGRTNQNRRQSNVARSADGIAFDLVKLL